MTGQTVETFEDKSKGELLNLYMGAKAEAMEFPKGSAERKTKFAEAKKYKAAADAR